MILLAHQNMYHLIDSNISRHISAGVSLVGRNGDAYHADVVPREAVLERVVIVFGHESAGKM